MNLVLTRNMTIGEIKDLIKNLDKQEIFNYWGYKRDVVIGEKEKLVSYNLFLALYDLYPDKCLDLVEKRIFKEIGYWKDIYLIWGLINKLPLDDREKYKKYNNLIKQFRQSIIDQRLEDLKTLNNFIRPNNLSNIDNKQLREYMESCVDKPDISNLGKYCVREKSKLNNSLYWYIKIGRMYKKESHVSYICRGSLKIKTSDGIKQYPEDKPIPPIIKKTYRELNSKLNIALEVPEVMLCQGNIDLLKDKYLPREFTIRNRKCLEKNNLEINLNRNCNYFNFNFFYQKKSMLFL